MSKYCAKCGKEISDTATFCPSCGAKVAPGMQGTSGVQFQKATPGTTRRKTPILAGVVALVLLFVVIFGIRSLMTPAYEKPIKLFEEGINKGSFSKMKKALSPGLVEDEFGIIPDSVTDEQLDDALQNEMQNDFGIGTYKIELKVNGKEKIDSKNLEQVLQRRYGINDDDARQAKAAYLLNVKVTASIDSGTEEENIKMVVIKIGGTWYIASLDF